MFYKTIILLVLHLLIAQGEDTSLFCDERFTVVSDLKQKNCDKDTYLHSDPSISECVRFCKTVTPHPGDDCEIKGCPPGFLCLKDKYGWKCQIDGNSCLKYYTVYGDVESEYNKVYLKPQCSPDGTWAPKQCKGEKANGRCFCSDEGGKRIFGQQWSTKSENMTCACSRERVKLEKDENIWFVSLHCDGEGNYEPLQCNMIDEQCWCAEPKTGKLTSQIVPESMRTYLPCYDEEINGERYLRQCESHLFAQRKIARALSIHGMKMVNFPHVMCDADGSYGTYSISGGTARCTWRDNNPLPSAESETNYELMNCNCARDRKILPSQTLICRGDGSYQPHQKSGSQYFCVDLDGFQNSEILYDDLVTAAGECIKLYK